MDMAVKSPSPSVHSPLLGLHIPVTSPHNPLGIEVVKDAETGLAHSNLNPDEGTEVARQVSNCTVIISLFLEGWHMLTMVFLTGMGLC